MSSQLTRSRTPPAPATCRASREAHAARRARALRRDTVGARHAACAGKAAPGRLLALEAHLHHRKSSLNTKSATHIELLARQHRSSLTESEARLWSGLKARQLGVTFRRQVPVGSQYIADFLAPSIGLIVEVDGAYHGRRQRADERRELKLRRLGFRVVRVSAELVLTDLAAAVALVRAAL
jgi:very-short-patch-repair endonuclease